MAICNPLNLTFQNQHLNSVNEKDCSRDVFRDPFETFWRLSGDRIYEIKNNVYRKKNRGWGSKIETQSCNASEKSENKMKAKIFKQISNYDIPFNEKIWGVNLLIIISNVHVHFEYTNETHSFCTITTNTGPPYREIFRALHIPSYTMTVRSHTTNQIRANGSMLSVCDHRLGFC